MDRVEYHLDERQRELLNPYKNNWGVKAWYYGDQEPNGYGFFLLVDSMDVFCSVSQIFPMEAFPPYVTDLGKYNKVRVEQHVCLISAFNVPIMVELLKEFTEIKNKIDLEFQES